VYEVTFNVIFSIINPEENTVNYDIMIHASINGVTVFRSTVPMHIGSSDNITNFGLSYFISSSFIASYFVDQETEFWLFNEGTGSVQIISGMQVTISKIA
jgi:hypothetical protein